MPAARVCTECGKSLSGRSTLAKTCSAQCRQARHARIKRAGREEQEAQDRNGPAAQEIREIVQRTAPDAIHRVLKQELAPIVRDAITEDVLRAINDMVGLTPTAVAALEDDLASDDKVLRHRAYALALKYTVGHPALVKPEDADGSKQIVVNFNLPRPGEEDGGADLDVVDEMQQCDVCEVDKPLGDFVAGSTRCQACFDKAREEVLARFQ